MNLLKRAQKAVTTQQDRRTCEDPIMTLGRQIPNFPILSTISCDLNIVLTSIAKCQKAEIKHEGIN